MKVLALSALLALVNAAPLSMPEPGKSYEYSYVATAVSGIPGTSENSTGLRMKMTLVCTYINATRLSLKVSECSIEHALSKFVAAGDESSWQDGDGDLCNEIQKECIVFDLTSMGIPAIYTVPSEQDPIVNIKRGVMSAFLAVPTGRETRKFEQLTDVLGGCNYKVIESVSGEEIVLLKERELESCSNRMKDFSTILPETKEQEAMFVFGSTSSEHIFSNTTGGTVLTRATIRERQSFAPLSKDGGAALTTIEQYLTLKGETENVECPNEPDNKTSIIFKYPDFSHETATCKVKEIINKVATQDPKLFAELFADTVEEMRKCTYDALRDVVETYKLCFPRGVNPTDVKRAQHALTFDALAYVGTCPAIKLIGEMTTVQEEVPCLSSTRKRELAVSLSMVPLRYCSPCFLLSTATEMARTNSRNMTFEFVVGAIINEVTEHPNYVCSKEIEEAFGFLEEQWNGAMNVETGEILNVQKAVHTLKAMGNAKLPRSWTIILTALNTTGCEINSTSPEIEVRLAALYALGKVGDKFPSKVREIVLPMFMSRCDEAEVRIAAYLAYMKTLRSPSPPNLTELKQLILSLQTEPNTNVKTFVYTHLLSLEKSDNPTRRSRREIIAYVITVTNIRYWCSYCDMGYFSSKAQRHYGAFADLPMKTPLPRDIMGLEYTTTVLFGEIEGVPRSSTAKFKVNTFGYDINLMEMGVRGTGIERLIRHLFGPTGYLRLGTRVMKTSGLSEPKACPVEQEPMYASGYVKMFGSEMAWNSINESELMHRLYDKNFLNVLREEITDTVMEKFAFRDISTVAKSLYNYFDWLINNRVQLPNLVNTALSKSTQALNVYRSIPTTIGLPLNISVKMSAHAQVKAKVDGTFSSTEIKLEGNVEPIVGIYSTLELVLDGIVVQPKITMTGRSTAGFQQEGTATLDDQYHLKVELTEMPAEPESIIAEFTYEQHVEVGESRMELSTWKHNRTKVAEPFGIEILGINITTPISYPNTTGVPFGPLFPLSGRAEGSVRLRSLTPAPTSIIFNFWNETLISVLEGTFYSTLTTVGGVSSGLNGTYNWYTTGSKPFEQRVISLKANSVPGNASAHIVANTWNRVDVEAWMTMNTTICNSTCYARFNRTHFYGNVSRDRHTVDNTTAIIRFPEFRGEINGSLVNNTEGNISAILYLEGSDKPQWLRVNTTTIGLMVNLTAESSLFNTTNMGYVLPYPLKAPICKFFKGSNKNVHHIITFDDYKMTAEMKSTCEFVLARQRNESDNFAVTVQGENIHVYINETKYTLVGGTTLQVDGHPHALPYKVKHVVNVRSVTVGTETYTRLSAWAGVDIYANGHGMQLAVNGFYAGMTGGLCGNSDGNATLVNELETPCGYASTVAEFIESWAVTAPAKSCDVKEVRDVSQKVMDVAVAQCAPIFETLLVVGHSSVKYQHYLSACLHDVAYGGGPEPSIRGYKLALAAKHQIPLEACEYGSWSRWSDCMNGTKSRYRQVIKTYVNSNCHEQIQEAECQIENPCHPIPEYASKDYEHKKCLSVEKLPACPANHCKPVKTERKLVAFRCSSKSNARATALFADDKPIMLPWDEATDCVKA